MRDLTVARELEVICGDSQLDIFVVQNVLDCKEYPVYMQAVKYLDDLPIIDIGAHVGAATLMFSHFVKPSKIHAYEPYEEAAKLFRENTKHLDNVTLFQEAVSSRNGNSELFIDPGSRCLNSLKYHWPIMTEKRTVPTVTGETALKRIEGPIGILKVDTEGSELDILQSAVDELGRVLFVYVEHDSEEDRKGIEELLDEKFFLIRSDVKIAQMPDKVAMPQGVHTYVNRALKEAFLHDLINEHIDA